MTDVSPTPLLGLLWLTFTVVAILIALAKD